MASRAMPRTILDEVLGFRPDIIEHRRPAQEGSRGVPGGRLRVQRANIGIPGFGKFNGCCRIRTRNLLVANATYVAPLSAEAAKLRSILR